MKEFVDKLSSYHLLNYLLPGVIFIILAKKFTGYDLMMDNLIMGLFLYYFIGLFISRIGSLVIDPSLKRISFINPAPHGDYISASQKDQKLESLSEVNNLFRSLATLSLLLVVLKLWKLLENKIVWVENNHYWILVLVLFILFLYSYKKQTQLIVNRISAIIGTRTR